MQNNGRLDDSSFLDVLTNIDSLDRIYIYASNSSGTLGFSEDGNQINIFHNGAHEASILGSGLSINEVRSITSIVWFLSVPCNDIGFEVFVRGFDSWVLFVLLI